MPPRTNASKPVSVVDQMGEDATPVAPDEYPPGTPELKPMLSIRPRSRRAEFKRKISEINAALAECKRIEAEGKRAKGVEEQQSAQFRLSAAMDDLYQIMDEALTLAAVDPDAYAKWSDEASDVDLNAAFTVYQRRTQPGEASSSTS
jgi:hypothetical protein